MGCANMPQQPLLFDLPPLTPPSWPDGFRFEPELISPAEEQALIGWVAELPFQPFEFHGFVVDAGLATFLDNEAKPAIDQDKVANLDGDVYKTMLPHTHYGWRYTLYPFGKFNMAIADEAYYLKNSDAKRTEQIVPILQACKRVILLAGTPALARPKEIYNLL
ncbi:MAG: hypothetical protein EOO81_09735, partial [Oxalobacteraceae bacterium]